LQTHSHMRITFRMLIVPFALTTWFLLIFMFKIRSMYQVEQLPFDVDWGMLFPK